MGGFVFCEAVALCVFTGLDGLAAEEASIDVLGRYCEDQLSNIINIWRRLPSNYILIIKEHTNAIGDRPYSFYKKLMRLPNLFFVDENVDSHELISIADYIVTVSGTVAYEAALMGKQSYTLCQTFFNRLEKCDYIENMRDFKFGSIKNRKIKMTKIIFYEWLWKRSFPGIISDPISNANCISDNNISLLSDALRKVIKKYEENRFENNNN